MWAVGAMFPSSIFSSQKLLGTDTFLRASQPNQGWREKKLYRRLRKKYGDYRADGVEAAALGVASHFWREQNSIPIYSLLS